MAQEILPWTKFVIDTCEQSIHVNILPFQNGVDVFVQNIAAIFTNHGCVPAPAAN